MWAGKAVFFRLFSAKFSGAGSVKLSIPSDNHFGASAMNFESQQNTYISKFLTALARVWIKRLGGGSTASPISMSKVRSAFFMVEVLAPSRPPPFSSTENRGGAFVHGNRGLTIFHDPDLISRQPVQFLQDYADHIVNIIHHDGVPEA